MKWREITLGEIADLGASFEINRDELVTGEGRVTRVLGYLVNRSPRFACACHVSADEIRSKGRASAELEAVGRIVFELRKVPA